MIKLNQWNIPDWLEEKARKRDKYCVYCHVFMKYPPSLQAPRSRNATIEHIDNDEHNIDESNIAICCNSCNASKGSKYLLDWFNSQYCMDKGINKETVAPFIKKHIINILNTPK